MLPISVPYLNKTSNLKTMLALCLVLSFIQILSDYLSSAEFTAIPKIFGLQVFLMLSFATYLYRKFSFNWALIVTAILMGTTLSNALFSKNSLGVWKYLIGMNLSICLLSILVQYGASRNTRSTIGFLLMGIFYFNDSRIGLVLLGSYVFLEIFLNQKQRKSKKSNTGTKSLAVVVILISLIATLSVLLPVVAKSNLLGERSKSQFLYLESIDRTFYFLPYIRKEFFSTMVIGLNGPLLGVGSYGTPDGAVISKSLDFFERNVAPLTPADRSYLLYPTGNKSVGYNPHSVIGAFAVWGGLLTLTFWIYLIFFSLKILLSQYNSKEKTLPLSFLVALNLLWLSFFSPIIASTRVEIATSIFILSILQIKSKSNSSIKR